MVPLIVRVYVEDEVAEVPVTPETTCRDVIECVRDPGEEKCTLVETWGQGCERVLQDGEKPLEILQEWGVHQDQIKLILRYTILPVASQTGGGTETRNGMKEPGFLGDTLRDGVELTLSELEEMACRQQQQIDSQRQILAAKEQRLRFLKQHEARHQQVAAEHERLRRLRDRVEAQELKLRKLRALRGQVDQNKLNNASLTSDLDSIRALFNEKEKELSVAVAKVEELTRQLEELRRGRNGSARETTPSAAAQELEKLRRELMYRNKLNEQQNVRLNQQREALSQRQEEMTSIDKRISELQDRLHRKRLLNQQLANQITAASNKAASTQQQQLRNVLSASAIQHHQQQQQQPQMYQQSHSSVPNVGNKQLLRPLTSGNIAAIEPYHHVPSATSKNISTTDNDDFQKQHLLQSRQQHSLQTRNEIKNERDSKDLYINRRPHISETGVQDQPVFNNERFPSTQDDFGMKIATSIHKNNNIMAMTTNQNYSPIDEGFKMKDDKCDVSEVLPEFGASKSDPKYQTLPYNTKFTVNYVTQQPANSIKNINSQNRRPAGEGGENLIVDTIEGVKNNNNSVNHVNNNMGQQQQLMSVVHSIPIPAGANKGLATPLANQNSSKITSSISSPSSSSSSSSSYSVLGNLQPRVYGTSNIGMSLLTRGQPVGGTSSTTSSTSSLATNSSGSSSSHQIVVSPISCTTSLLSSLPSTSTNTLSNTTTTTTSSSCTVLGKMFTLPPTSLSLQFQKPVSSVAPTSVQHPSPIYQTSSTKIHPVQPQTLSSTPQGIFRDQKGDTPSPQSSSTPVGAPDSSTSKPALPPKPALPVKPTPPPPPRQAHWAGTEPSAETTLGEGQDISKRGIRGTVDISSEAVDSALNVLRGAVMLSTRGGMTDYSSGVKPTTSSVVNLPPPPPPPTSEPPMEDTPPRRSACEPIIKARPLTIRKQPPSEIPRLRSSGLTSGNQESKTSPDNSSKDESSDSTITTKSECDTSMTGELSGFGTSRRIEMPPAFLFPETEAPPADLIHSSDTSDQTDRAAAVGAEDVNLDEANKLVEDKSSEDNTDVETKNIINKDQTGDTVVSRRVRKGNLKGGNNGSKQLISRRVSFDPLALLLDASLEGELELVVRTAGQVRDPSAANDEGITALHNAICAGHLDIVRFLVQFGCDVNAQDSDGWTPLHCAASCNNLAMVRFLVEHGACIFATTLSDHETAAEKCEEDEEGFDGCSEYLYSVQEKLGILNNGAVYAVFDYDAHNSDELSFREGDRLVVLRKGDEWEREWWWARLNDKEGYIPRNLLGLYPRVHANKSATAE